MEPLATTFATIVGLIANYRSETRAQSDDEYKDFVEWLGEHRHQEIIDLLTINAKASISIKALLKQDRSALLDRLDYLDTVLTTLSSQIDGLAGLAEAVRPGAELSNQAISILRQMEEAQASAFLVLKYLAGQVVMHLLDGHGSQIEYSEPRYLEDDLATLVGLGLLLEDCNAKGEPIYRITRQGSKFVSMAG